jgi:hypothetical protein
MAPEKGDCDEWFRTRAKTAPAGQAHVGCGKAGAAFFRAGGQPAGRGRVAQGVHTRERTAQASDGAQTPPRSRRLDLAAFGLVMRLFWGVAWRGGLL